MKTLFYYNTDIGEIGIAEEDSYITDVFFGGAINGEFIISETPLINAAYKQIDEYLKGKRKSFDLPIVLSGTNFQKKVWNALKNIPYGRTVSYKDIAIAIGNEKASRAVGMANNRNPVSIIIPCHRVIGKNGKLVGYGGGIEIKEYLLRIESETKV